MFVFSGNSAVTESIFACVRSEIIAGKSVEALKRLYHNDVVAQENDEAERHGVGPWIEGRAALEKNIVRFAAKVRSHAAHGDTSFSEWEYDVEITGMGAFKTVQVAVRRWKNGKVAHERFYHK
jgi:hypothetical protein